MTLDEIRKLIDEATHETSPDAPFIAAARTLLPALLDVAEKADKLLKAEIHIGDANEVMFRKDPAIDLDVAIAALEALKLP